MSPTTSVYRGHSVSHDGRGRYTVDAYGVTFPSVARAHAWLDEHVDREQRQHVRKSLTIDPELMRALRTVQAESMLACSCSRRLATPRYVDAHPTPTPAMNQRYMGAPLANRMSRSLSTESLGDMVRRLGGNGWEKSEKSRARGRLGADARMMWELSAGNLYGTSDRIVCAAREMLQNSRDAVIKAVRRKQIDSGEIRFKVSKQSEPVAGQPAWTLECSDNGPGMSCVFKSNPRTGDMEVSGVLPDVFFNLGVSGGKGSDQTGEGAAVGGFGMAKGIILGVSSTWRFEVLTQSAIARSSDSGEIDYEELDAPVKGTTVRVFDIIQDAEERSRFSYPPEDRIAGMLAWSNLANVTVYLNGRRINPVFDRSRGRRVKKYNQEIPWSWGKGVTSAEVVLYKRPVTEGEGHFYVQIDGLYQFATHLGVGWDAVINMQMAVHAKDPRYPIPISRDGFKFGSEPYWVLSRIREELTRENMSAAREPDYETELPTDTSAGASTVHTLAQHLGASIREAAELIRSSHEIASTFFDTEAAAANIQASGMTDDLTLPTFSGVNEVGKPRVSDTLERISATVNLQSDDFGEVYTGSDDGAEQSTEEAEAASRVTVRASPRDIGRAIQAALDDAGLVLTNAPDDAEDAIRAIMRGSLPVNLHALAEAIQWIGQVLPNALISRGMKGESGGDRPVISQLEAATTTKVILDALESLVDAVAQASGASGVSRASATAFVRDTVRRANPFAMFAVKIHKDFPRKSLRSFRRSPKKYLRVIMAWDATLRLIAGTVRIFPPFRVGFVFEAEVRGMQGREAQDGWEYVYINPIYALATVKTFKKDPRAVALYFYGLACHELAHMHHSAVGHDERFVAIREDIGFAAAHIFRAVEATLRKVFNLSGGGRSPGIGGGPEVGALKDQLAALTERLGLTERQLQIATAERDEEARERRVLADTRAAHFRQWQERARQAEERAVSAEQREERAAETYRRLFDDARESIGRVAGRMHAILAFGAYLDWLRGPGSALLPDGVDPEQLVTDLQNNPRVVADYLLGDGLVKTKQIGEALSGHTGPATTQADKDTAAEAIEAATLADMPSDDVDDVL